MKRLILPAFILVVLLSSFHAGSKLIGVWEFSGGVYNGKPEGAPVGYTLHRKYDQTKYTAVMLEKGAAPFKYEEGSYTLNGDTCTDTETFSSEPSKITGIPIHYLYNIQNDTLVLRATLPTGLKVEEYWKKVKSAKR